MDQNGKDLTELLDGMIRGIPTIKLPKKYPGSLIGYESSLRDAKRELEKTLADASRWQTAAEEKIKRDNYAREYAENQERERKISQIWHEQMNEWERVNKSAIQLAKKTGDWSSCPPAPDRSLITI